MISPLEVRFVTYILAVFNLNYDKIILENNFHNLDRSKYLPLLDFSNKKSVRINTNGVISKFDLLNNTENKIETNENQSEKTENQFFFLETTKTESYEKQSVTDITEPHTTETDTTANVIKNDLSNYKFNIDINPFNHSGIKQQKREFHSSYLVKLKKSRTWWKGNRKSCFYLFR